MTRKFQPRLQCIQSATGENLTEPAEIADSLTGYCEDLYRDEEGKGIEQKYWEQEPPSLRSEVAHAIRQAASCKATGPDEVPAELSKAGGKTVPDRICVAIWETGEWPEEWTFSTFIPLPQKDDLKQCANYRTIALVSHASKILLIFGSYINLIQSPQFGTKSQREVPQFSSYKNFLITKCGIGRTNRQTDTLRQRTPR